MGRRHPHVVNADEVEPVTTRQGARFAFVRRQLGAAAGGRGLGASLMELPPGKAAWPSHFHCANEEAVFVIQGTGELRIGDQRVPLRAGDYVALPPSPQAAHQIYNGSGAPLVYLAVSTMIPTDIAVYPASDKIGVFGGAAPGGPKQERFVAGFFRRADAVDYWDGEELDDDDEGTSGTGA
jgi:uncharacterized cupin superfamily protein